MRCSLIFYVILVLIHLFFSVYILDILFVRHLSLSTSTFSAGTWIESNYLRADNSTKVKSPITFAPKEPK